MVNLIILHTLTKLKSERDGYRIQTSSLTLLPGASQIITTTPIIDPDKKPGERLPYAKPASYGENWQASGIIHDFNNLLAIILSHTSIALTKLPAESTGRQNLDRAIRATKRAADLSSQLSFSLSHQQDDKAYTEPNALIQEVIELLEPQTVVKAALEWHPDCELFAVAVPRLRLQQVMMNLLLNAVEAIQVIPGQITLATYNHSVQDDQQKGMGQPALPPGHYAVIQITDTGMGMDQETLNVIFEPYFTTKATGMGIGLSTVLGIVHSYQGIVQVFSTPGIGSTFRIFLPALGHCKE